MRKVLLADESLTVQKVVALTLGKDAFDIAYAKSRGEVMKCLQEDPPDLILVSDQMSDLDVTNFPTEIENWTQQANGKMPLVLITSRTEDSHRGYTSVLKKPFAPSELKALVERYMQPDVPAGASIPGTTAEEFEAARLEDRFNEAFSDEASLLKQTFEAEAPITTGYRSAPESFTQEVASRPLQPAGSLWQPGPPPENAVPVVPPAGIQRAPESQAPSVQMRPPAEPFAKSSALDSNLEDEMEKEIQAKINQQLEESKLMPVVDKVLEKIVPPIVERMVKERLDALLKEQESHLEMKP